MAPLLGMCAAFPNFFALCRCSSLFRNRRRCIQCVGRSIPCYADTYRSRLLKHQAWLRMSVSPKFSHFNGLNLFFKCLCHISMRRSPGHAGLPYKATTSHDTSFSNTPLCALPKLWQIEVMSVFPKSPHSYGMFLFSKTTAANVMAALS